MLIVRPTTGSNNVEKGLGSFKQAVKLNHKGGKNRKRKNMPGYYRGVDSLGRVTWRAIDDVLETYAGREGKKKYLTQLAKPGDVVRHLGDNYVVLGRLNGGLVVLDPIRSQIKVTKMEKEKDIVLRANLSDLFAKDPILLQRKIMGHYMSVKDILEHPDNYLQAKELINSSLLKMPEGFTLGNAPNKELLKLEPAKPKKKGELEAEDLVIDDRSAERFEAGETFKIRDYLPSAQIGDVILTSKNSHWTVVGKALVNERKQDENGKWEFTGKQIPALLVTSDKLDGVYALQAKGNRTYTMVKHGKGTDDQLKNLQKEVIVKSKAQGYTLKQLLDGSYVTVLNNTPSTKVDRVNSNSPKPDLDLTNTADQALAVLEHARRLLRDNNKEEVSFIVRDASGRLVRITATRDTSNKVTLSSRSMGGLIPNSNTRINTVARGIKRKGGDDGLLDSIVEVLDQNDKPNV